MKASDRQGELQPATQLSSSAAHHFPVLPEPASSRHHVSGQTGSCSLRWDARSSSTTCIANVLVHVQVHSRVREPLVEDSSVPSTQNSFCVCM